MAPPSPVTLTKFVALRKFHVWAKKEPVREQQKIGVGITTLCVPLHHR
jgi:hypothetical protein